MFLGKLVSIFFLLFLWNFFVFVWLGFVFVKDKSIGFRGGIKREGKTEKQKHSLFEQKSSK